MSQPQPYEPFSRAEYRQVVNALWDARAALETVDRFQTANDASTVRHALASVKEAYYILEAKGQQQ